MFVLGIDPGLSRCGYGAVRRGRRPVAEAAGVLSTPAGIDRAPRLAELQSDVRALIAELRPDVVAVERVLFQRNVATAMSVGQAAGVVMAESAAAGCDVVEYSPNEVKEAVAGWGGADKQELAEMVRVLLGLPELLSPADAADAVAVALCHLARVGPVGAGRAPAGGRAGGQANRVHTGEAVARAARERSEQERESSARAARERSEQERESSARAARERSEQERESSARAARERSEQERESPRLDAKRSRLAGRSAGSAAR